MSYQYYGIQDVSLTAAQRNTLVDALKSISNSASRPNWKNRVRVNNDGDKVIFCGRFNDSAWTVDKLTNRLAELFGVDPAIITSNITSSPYGPIVSFSANSTEKMKLIAFGGLLATWDESHDLVLTYMKNNATEWQ